MKEFDEAADWAEWLKSMDPIDAIRIGSILASGSTTRLISQTVDEITYMQTRSGGGEMTQVELADTLGVSASSVARRIGRWISRRPM